MDYTRTRKSMDYLRIRQARDSSWWTSRGAVLTARRAMRVAITRTWGVGPAQANDASDWRCTLVRAGGTQHARSMCCSGRTDGTACFITKKKHVPVHPDLRRLTYSGTWYLVPCTDFVRCYILDYNVSAVYKKHCKLVLR